MKPAIILFFLIIRCFFVGAQVCTDSLPDPPINEYIQVDEEPRPINMDDIRRQIAYPDILKEAGISGTFVVRVLVDTLGNYVRHEVIKSVHPEFDKIFEVHLPNIKFTPGLYYGRKIEFWVNIPFRIHPLDD